MTPLHRHRLATVRLVVQDGHSAREAGDEMGEKAATVRQWVSRYADELDDPRTLAQVIADNATPPPKPAAIDPTELDEEDALRAELRSALAAVSACEEANSWQAAAAHRRIVRDLRKQLTALKKQTEEEWQANPATVAAEIMAILDADEAVRALVLEALRG